MKGEYIMNFERIVIIRKLINDQPLMPQDRETFLNPRLAGNILVEDFYRDAYSAFVLVSDFLIDNNFTNEYFNSPPVKVPQDLDDLYHIYSLLLEVKSGIKNQRERIDVYKHQFMKKLGIEILAKFTSIMKVPDEIVTLLGDTIKVLNDAFTYDAAGSLIDDWTYQTLRDKYNQITNKANINDLFIPQQMDIPKLPKNYGPVFRKEMPEPISRSKQQNLASRKDEFLPVNSLEKATALNDDLSGTLTKVKVIRGVGDEQGVDTWLRKHISTGLVNPDDIDLIVEYKYDGVATEARMVGTSPIEARTRGDKELGVTNDISNLIKFLPFRKTGTSLLPDTMKYGMQFEILMNRENLLRYRIRTGKEYANCRTAITSIVTSITGPQLREFITLAPIRTDLDIFETRLKEIEWIDENFGVIGSKLPVSLRGNLEDVLQKLEIIYQETFDGMDQTEFLYDGLVISFNDKKLEAQLGRINNTNEFSVALKFPNIVKQAKFLGYDLTVGKNGQITPMIKFSETYFYGHKYDQASGASLAKIQELGLREGDIIDIEYTNYVMPAVLGRNEQLSAFNNETPVMSLPIECPSCHLPLVIGDSGKMLYCTNVACEGRIVKRISNMMAKLGFENMADATAEKLKIKSIKELILLTKQKLIDAGYQEKTSNMILEQIKIFKNETHNDYMLFGSLGIDGASNKTLRPVFMKLTPREILDRPVAELLEEMNSISGIGPKTAMNIINFFKENSEMIRDTLMILKVVFTKGAADSSKKKVVFTNVSSSMKKIVMNKLGDTYEEDSNVTKSTSLLVVGTNDGKPSSKEQDAKKYGIKTKRLFEIL
jgi:NAD-dependent DNA ligase